jgi:Fe2+ or Zn2+ uptake regulation protein
MGLICATLLGRLFLRKRSTAPDLELFLISFSLASRSQLHEPKTVKLSSEVTERLAASGIRLTRQREEVLAVLLQKRDHPTAVEVFMRSKKHMPTISLATVYNCLEALVESGLAKQVNLDRAPTRYCANLLDHSHFFCEECGAVHDIEILQQPWNLPGGYLVKQAEVTFRGKCPACTSKNL